jgi:hypothetical protein
MCHCVDHLFDDKRVCIVILMIWLGIVLTIFQEIGLLNGRFMQLGPSSSTIFMSVPIDTWYKYNLVALFTFLNTSVNDFMSDAISPWLLNTVSDHKTRYLPYSKSMCLVISQTWSVYCNIMSVFGMFLAMSQVDFVLIRMCTDLMVNMYTNLKFMRNKTHSPERYYQSACGSISGSANEMQKCPLVQTSSTHTIDIHSIDISDLQEGAER